MYRGRLWTMRQYAGFGTAAESNRRYRYLLAQGVSGLSVAFDLPTQIGYDSDHPLAAGEVGRVGVAIDSIEDMAALFDGIPLDRVSTSMTINATAIILLALYVAVARRQGVAAGALSGTRAERHPEGVRRARHLHLPAAAVAAHRHRHLRVLRARAAAVEHRSRSAAITSARRDRRRCRRSRSRSPTRSPTSQAAIDAGLDVNAFGQRLSFFFNAHNNFLEEIAKFRAARRLWARDHARPLRRDQPARAAAALPHADGRQHADRAAARQQHRARRAAGAGGGARRHAVAALQRPRRGAGAADRGERDDRAADAADHPARERRRQHRRSGRRLVRDRGADERGSSARRPSCSTGSTRLGGTLAAIEAGYIQQQIQDSAYRAQQAIDAGDAVVVGVNRFADDGADSDRRCSASIPTSSGGRSSACARVRASRSEQRVARGARRGRARRSRRRRTSCRRSSPPSRRARRSARLPTRCGASSASIRTSLRRS